MWGGILTIIFEYIQYSGQFLRLKFGFRARVRISLDFWKFTSFNFQLDKRLQNKLFSSFFSDVTVCAHSPVSLHLVGMSSHPEVFSVHINGQVLQHNGHKVSSVGLISSSTATVGIVAVHTGRWLISSHTVKHIHGNGTHQAKTAFTHITYEAYFDMKAFAL